MLMTRADQWKQFSEDVEYHIVNYTIPQYGDAPHDLITNWTIEQCLIQLQKYIARANSNTRGPVEQRRDLLKIAHYACMIDTKVRGRIPNGGRQLEWQLFSEEMECHVDGSAPVGGWLKDDFLKAMKLDFDMISPALDGNVRYLFSLAWLACCYRAKLLSEEGSQ